MKQERTGPKVSRHVFRMEDRKGLNRAGRHEDASGSKARASHRRDRERRFRRAADEATRAAFRDPDAVEIPRWRKHTARGNR